MYKKAIIVHEIMKANHLFFQAHNDKNDVKVY